MPRQKVLGGLVVGLLLVAGGGLLMGASGRAQLLLLVGLIVAAVPLGVFLALRKTKYAAQELKPERGDRRVAVSRAVLPGAVAGGAIAGIAVLVGLFVAEGEARGHVFFHLGFGVTIMLLFTAVGLMWRLPSTADSSAGRTALLSALWISAGGTLFESIGAGGYDAMNATTRIGWLTALHGLSTPIAGIGLLMIPVGGITLAALVLKRLLTHRRTAKLPS